MEKHVFKKLNNNGASLIMVVISIAFLSLLGTIIITAALRNFEMKSVDRKSKMNFYSAEAALEEIKTGLTEDVAEVMANAYQEVLKNYSDTNLAMRKKLFESKVIEGVQTALKVSNLDNTISPDVLSDYLLETKKTETSKSGASVMSTPIFQVNAGDSFTIQNVKINYTNNSYQSSITTDIKVLLPDLTFDVTGFTIEPLFYKNYALIADEGIYALTSSNRILGDVYAGSNGINVSNQGNLLSIQGDSIISKGDITVNDKAALSIQKLNSTQAEVWAKNIITTQSDKKEEHSLPTKINITADTYVQDDLILEAKKSIVDLDGEYYGFSSGNIPEMNSAIMINAADADLKLDGLDKLTLAGRAFINLSNSAVSYLTDARYEVLSGSNSSIQTGESLAVKGNQEIYLLPASFLAVGHNPVSWDEYTSYYYNTSESLVNISEDAVIFDSSAIPENEKKLTYYLDDVTPVKKEFYRVGTETNMVYYYLNFKSEELATTYTNNFNLCYPNELFDDFPVNSITLNNTPDGIVTAGNIMDYETDNSKLIQGNNGEYINNYGNNFINLTTTLDKNKPGSGSVFENMVNTSKIIEDSAKNHGKAYFLNNIYYVSIIDNKSTGSTYILDEPEKEGIVIATGDIEVRSNFTGMILSGGQVNLYNGAQIDARPSLIDSILTSNEEVRKYFTEFNDSPEGDDGTSKNVIDISKLIVYENWRKN